MSQLRRWVVLLVGAAVAAYLLGLSLEWSEKSLGVISRTLALRLVSYDGGLTGIESLSSGDTGTAFLTLFLALATAYLGFETRRVAAETRRLAGTTQTEIDLLTKQTAALTRQADALDAQLLETRTAARAAAAPVLWWSVSRVDADMNELLHRVYLDLRATNVGGPGIMGRAKIENGGEIEYEDSDKLIPTSGTYDVKLSLGPFPSHNPFGATTTLIQSFRPLAYSEFAETHAVISVAGRGEFFNDWSAEVMTADSDEARGAVPEFLNTHRLGWAPETVQPETRHAEDRSTTRPSDGTSEGRH
jgi:hypothetical protein